MAAPRQYPPKHTITCPHCGRTQSEYVHARTTICRLCGDSIRLSEDGTPLVSRARRQLPAVRKPGFFSRLAPWLYPGKPRATICFECGHKQEVCRSAASSQCSRCASYLDLSDYKVHSAFSRNIRTNGRITVTASGDLNSTRAASFSAEVTGSVRGSLFCSDELVIKRKGKIAGNLSARRIVIHRKADVHILRPIHAGELVVRGRLECPLIESSGTVSICRKGIFHGEARARAFSVERGGEFNGQLRIGEIQPPTAQESSAINPEAAIQPAPEILFPPEAGEARA